MDFFQQLLDYKFLSNALIISIVVGIVCGTVGSLIVLRGLSLMGDAMSHAVLPGVALSFLFPHAISMPSSHREPPTQRRQRPATARSQNTSTSRCHKVPKDQALRRHERRCRRETTLGVMTGRRHSET